MFVINLLLDWARRARRRRVKKWWQTFQKTDTYTNLALIPFLLGKVSEYGGPQPHNPPGPPLPWALWIPTTWHRLHHVRPLASENMKERKKTIMPFLLENIFLGMLSEYGVPGPTGPGPLAPLFDGLCEHPPRDTGCTTCGRGQDFFK